MRNRYEIVDDIVRVYFNNCDDYFIIGTPSLERLLEVPNTWHKDKDGYVRGRVLGKSILLHRWLTNCPKGMKVDHRNRNKLDNRMSNLRICTNAQNLQNPKLSKSNSTGYRNVHWNNTTGKYQVVINKKYYGSFDNPEEANQRAKEVRLVEYPYSID